MGRVREVDLGRLGIQLPLQGVGMVVAQPYVELAAHEPFTRLPAQRARALECMDATLAVALGRVHRADKTHFTVFPELSIPGIEGVARITAAMQQEDWPVGTLVIDGVEGLTRNQYAELLAQPNTCHDAQVNGPTSMCPVTTPAL